MAARKEIVSRTRTGVLKTNTALRPFHPVQEQFVAVCRGTRRARHPAETAWLKLERALPQRDRN